MRFWQEFRNPKLKCERVGHKNIVEWRQGYQKPTLKDWDFYRVVVHNVTQERTCCVRCKKTNDWEIVKKEGINGLTASQTTWDKVNAGTYWPYTGWRWAS